MSKKRVNWKSLSDWHILEIGRQMNYDQMGRTELENKEKGYYLQLKRRKIIGELIHENQPNCHIFFDGDFMCNVSFLARTQLYNSSNK